MNGLFPIIRRKRRPLAVPDGSPAVNPLALQPDRLPPVAVVPESMPDAPTSKPKKSRDVATKN
jgi:hypothetical protein